MKLQGLAKFVIGFLMAIAILFFAGVSTARYLINRLSALPPRPVFPNDAPASDTPAPSDAAVPDIGQPSPVPSAPPSAAEVEAYSARVTQPAGLVLRAEPSRDSEALGGLDNNEDVVVLQSSPDGEWLRVRVNDGGEGWIKAGNTQPIE